MRQAVEITIMDASTHQNDHDILIELRTEMKGMRGDLKDMKNGTEKMLSDHEGRLRSLEKSADILTGKIVIISAFAGIIIVIIAAWIQKMLNL